MAGITIRCRFYKELRDSCGGYADSSEELLGRPPLHGNAGINLVEMGLEPPLGVLR